MPTIPLVPIVGPPTSTRPQLSPQAIFQIPLANGQALEADQSLAANLATQATATQTTSPLHVYYSPPYTIQSDGGAYATPFYNVPLNTPRQGVWSNRFHGTFYQTKLDVTPLPDPALLPGNHIGASGTDGSCAIWCGNEFWEFWQIKPAVAGGVAASKGYAWECSQGGYVKDITAYTDTPSYQGGFYAVGLNQGWGVSASGETILGGRLMADDYWRGTINHALTLALPLTGGSHGFPAQLPPATRHDVFNFTSTPNAVADAYRVPQGSWFRLPAGFDSVAWALAHHTRAPQDVVEMVCRAIRDYGLMINDSAGVLGFGCEGFNSYGTPYSPWRTDQQPPWNHFGIDLPWDQMVQIARRNA